LRQEQCRTQEDLAEAVGYSKRTIENIEAGKAVLRQTLTKVAQALGVPVEQITLQPPRKHAVVELILDRPFHSFAEEALENFLLALKDLLHLTGDIRLISRRPGSVVLTLEFTEEDSERLFRGVAEGRLSGLKLVGARRLGATELERDAWTLHPGEDALPPPRFHPSEVQADALPRPAVSTQRCSVLVVDDEPMLLALLTRLLAEEFEVLTAESADAAEAVFARRSVDILLTDQRMPRRSGVQLLEWVREHHPRTVRLLMTGYVELDGAVEAINRGQVYYYISKPWHDEALLQALRNAAEKFELERSRDQLLEELRRSNRELEEANHRLLLRTHELEDMAMRDPLTGLYNRRAIEDLAHFELRRHVRYPSPLSIGLIDVDQFDVPGTDFPWSESDALLERLGRTLARSLREVDSVGRLHGAKFLAIARETGDEGAARLAERIRSTVAAIPFPCDGQVLRFTLSLGFAVIEVGVHADLEAMLDAATAALAEAKAAGRNRCVIRRLPPPLPEDV
jgi:diguanylate cyclase (GGDEF)-like protein